MKRLFLLILIIVFVQMNGGAQEIVRLYEGKAPGSEDWNYKEVEWDEPQSGIMFRNVVDPTLAIYKPDKSVASETTVIICPGGGNVWLSYSLEGTEIAKWLAGKGITACVLKYRLMRTPEDPDEFKEFQENFMQRLNFHGKTDKKEKTEILPDEHAPETFRNFSGEDGVMAIRYLRGHAEELGINPDKVGIMGFSAGAGVTIYTILNSSPKDQPDFAGAIYGGWLENSKIPENAPPLFILAASDDSISDSCPDLYKAWKGAGISAELHLYSKGGHGFGFKQRGLPVDSWPERFYEWLKITGF